MVIVYAKIFGFILDNIGNLVKAILLIIIAFMGNGLWKSDTELSKWEHKYSTLETQTTKTINSLGDTITSIKTEYHTVSELKDSQNATILDLMKRFTDVKQDNHLLATKLNAKSSFQTRIIYDTLVYSDPYTNDSIRVAEYEHYTTDVLDLTRIRKAESDSSIYDINYHPKLFVQIGWYKLGKWKLKNLFKSRPKVWETNITSNDPNLSVDSVTSIYTGKFNNVK